MQNEANQRGTERGARGVALAWCALGALVCFTMGRLEPNLLEEGLLLHVGERMLAGDALYSDIVLVTGPFPYTFVAAIFWLFGPKMLAARAGIALLHGLACGAVFDLARQGRTGPWAHAAAAVLVCAPVLLFPLLSAAFYTTVSTSLTFVAAWLAFRAIGSERAGFAAGVAIAVTALSKQTIGALLALFFVATVLACAPKGRRVRHALAVCFGGAATAVVTLGWFAAVGDLRIFVESLLATPSGNVFSSPFIDLWPPGELSPELEFLEYYYVPEVVFILRDGALQSPKPLVFLSQLLFVLPIAVIGATALLRAFGPLPKAIWILFGATVACGSNLFPRADSGHLVFAAPAALAYTFCLVPLVRRNATPAWPARIAATTVIALLAVASVGVGRALWAKAGEATYGPKVTVRPVSPPKRAGAIPRVITFLRNRLEPGEPIFVARTEPLLYYATGAPNPTPYTGALQVWGIRGEQQDTILEALDPVRFVVMSDLDEPIHTYFRDELPRVQDAFERFYAVPRWFSGRKRDEDWLIVLARGPDRGPTLIDLFDPGPRAKVQAFIRKPDGRPVPTVGPMLDLPTRQNRRPLAHALGARGGGVDWELVVPPEARLQVATGYRKLHRSKQPSRLEFAVRVSTGGPFETLATRVVEFTALHGNGRRWNDLEVDLAAYANQAVVLRLEAVSVTVPRAGSVAFWGSPRIAGPPVAGEGPSATPER